MAKIRLGKRERAERKAQYAMVKAAKGQVIAENLSTPREQFPSSRGYRFADVMQGYVFHGASNMGRMADSFGRDGTKPGPAPRLPAGTGSWRK